jgi:hypothetical protein
MYQRPLSDIKYIIVHHSVTPEDFGVEDIRRMHVNKGYSDIGYHFLITNKGLKVGRPAVYNGAHALAEKIAEPMNYLALGLCLVGNFVVDPPSNFLVNETAYALKRLCKKYKVPLDREYILPHYDVDYTACPGKDTMRLIYRKLGI